MGPTAHRRKQPPDARPASRLDAILLTLIALLTLTLGAFALGWTPYPFGTVVLVIFIAARLWERRRTHHRGR